MSKEKPTQALLALISDLNDGITTYFFSPHVALQKYREQLIDLHSRLPKNTLFKPLHNKLNRLLPLIEQRITLGSRYDEVFGVSLLQASDAMFQHLCAVEVDDAYTEQTLALLADSRPCWQILLSPVDYSWEKATYQFSVKLLDAHQLISLMERLSSIGKVTLTIDQSAASVSQHSAYLTTLQPLSWLEKRYPECEWLLVPKKRNTVESISHSDIAGLVAVFCGTHLPKLERYRQLENMSAKIRDQHYRPFKNLINIAPKEDVGNRLVPFGGVLTRFPSEDWQSRPIRIGGDFYAHSFVDQEENHVEFQYLGKDILPYSLYLLEVNQQTLAFDKTECLACLTVSEVQLEQDKDASVWYFDYQSKRVEVLDFSEGSDSNELILSDISHFLILDQRGKLQSVAGKKLRHDEGVCLSSLSQEKWIKNIWLTKDKIAFVEPWLEWFEADLEPPILSRSLENSVQRIGYYQMQLGDVSLWLDAGLVCDVVVDLPFVQFVLAQSTERAFIYGTMYSSRVVCGSSDRTTGFCVVTHGAIPIVFVADTVKWHPVLPKLSKGMDQLAMNVSGGSMVVIEASKGEKDYVLSRDDLSQLIMFWQQI